MKTCKSIMILLVTLSLMVPHLLQAVVINVPEDIETIQGAIQASEDGDVVLVAPGEYDENLDFLGKAITVTSHIHLDDNRDFIENTIIDGGRRDCVVAFNNEEGRNSVLRGFTIQNGIQDCGGGIDCQRLSSPELNDLLVTGNEARGYGGGIYFSFRTTPLIQRTTISNNRSSFGGGGVATCFPSSGQLSHVIISNNFATSRGGGIYSESGGSFEMDHVLIADNSTNGRGGGACITESGTSRFTNVTFSGNNAAAYPALESSISEFEMINCIIWDNADGVNYLATYFREDEDENEPSVYSFSYCDIQGGMDNFQLSRDPVVNWDEDSNIEINPLFIDPEGGNYYLNPESQCIDIGNPEFDEDPDGTRSDLGAFYFDQREMEQNIPNIALRWEIGWDENQIDWNRYFDEIYTDGEYTIPITVVNTGTEELQIEDITIDNNSFNVQPAQFNLQSRDTRRVNITFTPEEAGEIQCCIRIFSNDPDEPQVDIRMSVVTAPRPIIFVNPLNFNDELNTGNTNVHEIAIGNNGESNLTWHIERELISEPDPEERQNGPRRDDVGDLLGEIEFNFGVIRGITSDGELIWLVSHNNNRTGNMFAIDPFNHEVVREFSWDNMAPDDIFWDGEVFWVAGHLNGNNVFIILDNGGNIVDQIEMPAPRMAALGFNGEDLMFSYSYDTHAVYIVQKDNFNLEIIAEIPRGDIHGIMGGANIGGIEWVPAHDDGHLWMVYRNNPIANLAQCKINADWEIEAIQTIELEDRGYGSLWHDGVNLWTGGGEDFRFVKIWDDGIHEVHWFTIDTYEGTLQTDEEQIIELTLDATSLIGGEYRGMLNVFSNDPVDPELNIEINLDVIEIELPRNLVVPLSENWNLISININPDNEFYLEGEDRGPDIISMMQQLRVDEDNHHVRLLKNEDGLFYAPAFGFGNIQYWNLTEGYLINVDADVEATYVGEQIPFDTDIPLEEGWNYIAYLPTYELDANRPDYYTLSPIIDHVIIAKDGEGHFMLPGEFDFSNMPPWRETQGYQVRVDDDVVLNYPPEREEDVVARNQETKQSQRLRHFVHNYVTGENMSVLISSINGIEAHTGSEIAAFNSGEQIVGTGIVNSEGQCGLAVWGDDPATDQSEGLQIGEAFTLTMWDAKLDREIELTHETNMEGNRLIYETDGLSILEMEIEASIPDEFFLSDAYPNPFNASVRLSYGLPEDVVVKISVYDISGRLVSTLISSKFKAGIHSVIWESRSSAAGIYFIQMSTGDFRSIRKVTLLK
ncbi:MAG: T9SS type A sorting domain-containing protein [Calditrichaeota bacterium]|nr:T9SS type A sorting domain-containing protein [Calditrichota bacterium]